jgi:hypothetical protein
MECSILRTSLWGTSLQMPLAFLYLHQNGKRNFWMAPPGSVNVHGSPEKFTVEFKPIMHKSITLVCTGREYGDFGERIINTLSGDLEIFEDNQLIASAKGTAGLERR